MKQSISLDDFLAEQSKDELLCTLEIVPNDSSKITIMPWVYEKQGCSCDSAIIIDKNLIESVSPTDQIHFCCGKKLKVVEVTFKEDAAIKLADVFKMSLERATKKKIDSQSQAFTQSSGSGNEYERVYTPMQNFALSGCGLGQRESDVCKSGCECRDIHGKWYCCPMGCCP